jgi:subtilisin family serine protease
MGRNGVCFLTSLRFWRLFMPAIMVSSVVTPLFSQQLSDSAARQISDVLRIKRSLNRTQTKLSSSLILGAMAARNQTAGALPRTLFRPLKTDRQGLTLIDLKTSSVPAAERQILALGGEVVYSSQHNGAIRAKLSMLNVEALAQSGDVQSIRPAAQAHTNRFFAGRLASRSSSRAMPQFSLLNALHLAPFIGSVTSQGFVAHAANQVLAGGMDGTGVKIGVLSDSALPDRVAALIASGDLPAAVTVRPGQEGPSNGKNEGTAMMEIVHDLAPGAKLFFATAFTSEDSFADNIRVLRFVYGCDIIVDDVSYLDEPAFQDGIVAQAVNDVTDNGALYFSSAANSGNLTNRTSGTWEGDFTDGGDAGILINAVEGRPVRIHNFASSGAPQLFNTLTSTSPFFGLHWSDPLGHSNNDYDFFVFNSTGAALKAVSFDIQNGSQDPFEFISQGDNCGTATATGYCPAAGDRLVVVLFSGATRALHLDTERGTLAIGTTGATFGHNAGLSTVSMAATAWNSGHVGTQPFTGFQNPVETFSSDGPRKIFYNPDGSAITPGNFLFASNGGTTLQKPDLTAADGVFTKTPGFLPFFGTSAAAPHAAAIAALVKSTNPFLTNTQIRQIMADTALDTMVPGADRDSGFGITMAPSAVRAAMSPAP